MDERDQVCKEASGLGRDGRTAVRCEMRLNKTRLMLKMCAMRRGGGV